ncbi:acyl-CoA carboxylase subunit epsilon [Mycobacterium tuberculosis]|uniref:acyl-CoA carboxylase subunit epsilon n=1 Tax=Mycobacterium tuberculosis TaxID=1773 RepID=UPI001244A2E5|nr:acyl-CoA carboxylase subunit epsilon [Mycobacterium tuberculosis]
MGTCPCESSERNEPVSRVSGTNEVSDGNETNNPAEVSDGNETNNPAEVSDGNETNNPAPVSRVSGTNEVSDGNETNNPAPVSRVSGTNEVSDGNETNNPAPVSRVSGTNEVSDGNETNNPAPVTEKPLHPHEPHIEILRGQPTDQELAALIAVLGSISGSTPPAQPEPTRWGLPVDQLRYPVFSWQRITLQEMTHMRR